MSVTDTNYDQAIKRLAVLVAIVEQDRDLAPYFENARQWLEGVPSVEESSRTFRQLAKAQALSLNGERRAARLALLELIDFLAKRRYRLPVGRQWEPDTGGMAPHVTIVARRKTPQVRRTLVSKLRVLVAGVGHVGRHIEQRWLKAAAAKR